ncbi:hypothetical protein [Streptomyces sp. NPDC059378]|uniref:hypothetical protein n=1 Tax=Streptomyces sp. NPDC059378 TaxID=3346815 RepID=UPI0036AFE470
MTASSAHTDRQVAQHPQRHAFPWRATLLALAVGQLLSPVFSQIYGGAFTTADRPGDPPIVPVGWAFSIWLVVELLCLAYAAWALPEHRPDPDVRVALARPLSVVYAGFTCWLIAAEFEPVWTTVVVFAVMVTGLLKSLGIALRHRRDIARWPRLPRVLLWWMLGIYAGWSTVAVWINFTTALAGSGMPITGSVGVAAQLLVLAAATTTAVLVSRWTQGLLPYVLAASWALLTAALGAAAAGEPLLTAAAAAGLAVTVAAAAATRHRRFSRTRTCHDRI